LINRPDDGGGAAARRTGAEARRIALRLGVGLGRDAADPARGPVRVRVRRGMACSTGRRSAGGRARQ
jgi:hypothetical protein